MWGVLHCCEQPTHAYDLELRRVALLSPPLRGLQRGITPPLALYLGVSRIFKIIIKGNINFYKYILIKGIVRAMCRASFTLFAVPLITVQYVGRSALM